jgi:hypothetical protein
MLSIVMLSVIILNDIIVNVVILTAFHHAKHRFSDCRYAECRGAKKFTNGINMMLLIEDQWNNTYLCNTNISLKRTALKRWL